jgi:acetylornithine deacetylase/succinyl-diaminopimelate desuccinylase-like protein
MIGGATCRFQHDPLERQPQIQFVDEDVDHLHRIVSTYVVVEELGQQNALPTVLRSAANQPFESRLDEARLGRLISAVRAVRPERGNIEAAPYWSELPILSALGVPGVYFAPGDIRICHTTEENVSLQDYYDSIVALAALLAGADCREQVRAVERKRR